MNRRNVIRTLGLAPGLLATRKLQASVKLRKEDSSRLQYSVNAYSFNALLRSGDMTFDDMMEFAADLGLDAVDLTGYYFSSYPAPPPDVELFRLKRKALSLGLDISWTGIRTDFVNPDATARKAHRELLREWLGVSSKLGASIMRVFTGKSKHDGQSREEVKQWLIEEFKTCASYGEAVGVIVALQNHNEFLYTSAEVIDLMKSVDADWFGLILDIGSLRSGDPYYEIEKLAPYANYWFIKEFVYHSGVKTPVDMKKMAAILKRDGYQGYVSFESLSAGDPKQIVTTMYNSFTTEYDKL